MALHIVALSYVSLFFNGCRKEYITKPLSKSLFNIYYFFLITIYQNRLSPITALYLPRTFSAEQVDKYTAAQYPRDHTDREFHWSQNGPGQCVAENQKNPSRQK